MITISLRHRFDVGCQKSIDLRPTVVSKTTQKPISETISTEEFLTGFSCWSEIYWAVKSDIILEGTYVFLLTWNVANLHRGVDSVGDFSLGSSDLIIVYYGRLCHVSEPSRRALSSLKKGCFVSVNFLLLNCFHVRLHGCIFTCTPPALGEKQTKQIFVVKLCAKF